MAIADDIINGDINRVKQWLDAGEPVNDVDEYGYRPLIEAAIANHTDIAALLVERGAEIDATDVTGRTALHWAVENANLALCQLLLEKGADPNAYTYAKQPALIKPILRKQKPLKRLLLSHGADLYFAHDYINSKLIGHRFELVGHVYLADHNGRFVELDFEGFILEFTVDIILDSLTRFKNHYSAREMRDYFPLIGQIIHSLTIAAELLDYQQYMMDRKKYDRRIQTLLTNPLLILPIGCDGHAIALIKYKHLFAICDRGLREGDNESVVIYHMNRPEACDSVFLYNLLYTKQNRKFINRGIIEHLQLTPIAQLPITLQVTGNCSWANIEAVIPSILFILFCEQQASNEQALQRNERLALEIFDIWRDWDKDRALHQFIQHFSHANKARKAAIVSVLANILFQKFDYTADQDINRTNKMAKLLADKDYDFIIKSYITVYAKRRKTEGGKNLLHLLDIAGR